MANVLVNESSLEDIADAIRSKNGSTDTYKPAEMADAISAISGGGITPTGTINITANGTHDVTNYASANVAVPTGTTPTGTTNITQNGTHDVTNYASANVNVPNSYSASDEGKVVSNGALVSQTSDTVTTNDTYDTTLINSLTVNVQSGGGGASSQFVTAQSYANANALTDAIASATGYNAFIAFNDAEVPASGTAYYAGCARFRHPVLGNVNTSYRRSTSNAYGEVTGSGSQSTIIAGMTFNVYEAPIS